MKQYLHTRKGFTLIELMVSIAIMGILSAILVTGYAYQSAVRILERNATEFALQIREAQVYALGDREFKSGGNFPGYGVYVNPSTNRYIFFGEIDTTQGGTYNGSEGTCTSDTSDECVTISALSGGYYISEACANGTCSASNKVTIVFPAHSLVPTVNGVPAGSADISFATQRDPGIKRVVHVYSTGFVEVTNQ